MNHRCERGQIKRRLESVLRVGLRVWQVACIGTCLLVLGFFVWRVAGGIAQVGTGSMSSAEMLEELGAWLCGFEK